MQEILLCLALYLVFGLENLWPIIQKREWKYFKIVLPVYLVTLGLNLYIIRNGDGNMSLTGIIERLLSGFVK